MHFLKLLAFAFTASFTLAATAEESNVEEVQAGVKEFENVKRWDKDSGNIVFMTDEHFAEYRKGKQFLGAFIAPWCGHCKAAKPELGAASTKTNTLIVAMDCTSDGKNTCFFYLSHSIL